MNRIYIYTIWMLCTSYTCFSDQYPEKFEGQFKEYGNRRLDLIANYLPEDPVIFEAGGHYGDDTLKFINKWPGCTVYTFEPNPHAWDILIETVKHLSNVHPQNIAIADFNGTAIFHVCHGTTGDQPIYEGASSLLEASDYMEIHYQGPDIEVRCATLDDWSRANGIKGYDFLWMDMEGYELQALSASPEMLSTVKVIYIETNFQSFREGMTLYPDLRAFLEESGFKLLSHWYAEGLQGNAIFIRNELDQ